MIDWDSPHWGQEGHNVHQSESWAPEPGEGPEEYR